MRVVRRAEFGHDLMTVYALEAPTDLSKDVSQNVPRDVPQDVPKDAA